MVLWNCNMPCFPPQHAARKSTIGLVLMVRYTPAMNLTVDRSQRDVALTETLAQLYERKQVVEELIRSLERYRLLVASDAGMPSSR